MQQDLLSRRVYEKLYQAMLTNRIAPGDRLNRRQVAADLGVSVAPVLEAMTQLEWEGFLETSSPRQGTVVRAVTAAHSLGKFRLRQAIEVEAARLYAGAVIAREKKPLLEIARRLDATRLTSLANWKAEVEFHGRLVSLAGCPVLDEAFANVARHSLFHAACKLLPVPPARAESLHSRLVEALAKATPDEAESLLRGHLAPWIDALGSAADVAEDRTVEKRPRRRREKARLDPLASRSGR